MNKILDVQNLSISFSIQGQKLHAVRDVSFSLYEGESIGIVGESGCGKSATVLSLTRLIPSPPSQIEEGKVLFHSNDLLKLSDKNLQAIRGKEIGVIFQDPMTSLNPTTKIGLQITEGIVYHKLATKKQAKQRALELLHLVGISDPELCFSHYPHQLSGGMRQRVLIAIALSANPSILIADEPTTALDPTIQAQILDLLQKLREQFNMSLILISHDIGVVASLCDRVLVMYAGKIVEQGSAADVLNTPQHPYTRMLLNSLPHLHSTQEKKLYSIEGSPPALFIPPPGCPFADRCPQAMNICTRLPPPPTSRLSCWLTDKQNHVKTLEELRRSRQKSCCDHPAENQPIKTG